MDKFEKMGAEQYRAMSADEFNARKKYVSDLCLDPACEVEAEQLREEARTIKEEATRRNVAAELRETRAAAVASGAGAPLDAQSALITRSGNEEEASDDPTCSMEYRAAFRDYVCTGKMSDVLREVKQTRANASTTTTDADGVIPTVLVDRIIEKAESYGMILPLVTQTNYAAGVEIPVSSLKPTATWVSEGATSDRQKYTIGKVSFTHHKLRCEVSISQEVGAMAISAFENKLVETVARAIVKAKEQAILTGTGTGQPKGILAETPEDGQAIKVASGAGLSYQVLCDCEAALPQAYEATAKWFMSKKSFMAFVGMVDDNKQPIARVNYGVGGTPERSLLGREVILTGDYLPNYVKAPTADTVFACLFSPEDYVINSVYDMGISKKQDWDTEDLLTKAVTACDGKVVDKGSLVTLTVTKASA